MVNIKMESANSELTLKERREKELEKAEKEEESQEDGRKQRVMRPSQSAKKTERIELQNDFDKTL